MHWKIYQKLLTMVLFLFVIVNVTYGKDQKSKVVIFPFKNNLDSKCLVQGIEDVMRSELIRSGYFTVVEQEITYEFVKEAVLYNFIKIDNVDVQTIMPKAKTVDLFASVEPKIVIRVAEKMNVDFAVKGTFAQFGDKFRIDIDVVNVKVKETMSALVGECESQEKIPAMMEQLSQQIVNVCKGANVQKELDYIQSSYQDGKLTYEEAMDRLKKLSSEMPGVFAVHCALFSHYLGHSEMRGSLIEEGEEIVNLFNPDNEEDSKYLSLLGLDPFYELANAYIITGRLDNAIEVYNRAIKVYPLNHVKYYKQLGTLYKLEDRFDASIDAFKKVLSMDPSDFDARLSLIAVYEAEGDISIAIEQCQYCLKYAKNSSESSRVKEVIKRLQSKGKASKK